jgi:hypothetical protein
VFPCSRCHVGGATVPDKGPTVGHKPHLSSDLECGDCHDPEETGTPSVPAAELCFECHEDLANEAGRIRAYFDAVRKKDGAYVFPRRWKTSDTQPAHKRHAEAGVACSACHGEVGDGPIEKPRSVPLMQVCMDCHTAKSASVECQACHKEIRKRQHENIVLRHAEDQRGCLDCHDRDNRDVLRLVNGEKVPFERSYVLCGQCHGPKLREWKLGIHGKRSGRWDGRKSYLLCVHCHVDPHAPRFPEMKPDPPPLRPEDIR